MRCWTGSVATCWRRWPWARQWHEGYQVLTHHDDRSVVQDAAQNVRCTAAGWPRLHAHVGLDDPTPVLVRQLWDLTQLMGDRAPARELREQLQEKLELFEQVHAALKAEGRRWSAADADLVVADTTVFIHHPDKIRRSTTGRSLAPGPSRYAWWCPRIVIDELDRLKESGNQNVRWRAGDEGHWRGTARRTGPQGVPPRGRQFGGPLTIRHGAVVRGY